MRPGRARSTLVPAPSSVAPCIITTSNASSFFSGASVPNT
jgi:hypothetical protein